MGLLYNHQKGQQDLWGIGNLWIEQAHKMRRHLWGWKTVKQNGQSSQNFWTATVFKQIRMDRYHQWTPATNEYSGTLNLIRTSGQEVQATSTTQESAAPWPGIAVIWVAKPPQVQDATCFFPEHIDYPWTNKHSSLTTTKLHLITDRTPLPKLHRTVRPTLIAL